MLNFIQFDSQIAPRVGQFELIQFQIPNISHLSPGGGEGGGRMEEGGGRGGVGGRGGRGGGGGGEGGGGEGGLILIGI